MRSTSKQINKATKRHKIHPGSRQSGREHAKWRRNIAAGMRKAKLLRRKAGLMTIAEVAVETCLAVYAIKKSIESGELRAIDAGSHRYIHRSELDQWKARTGLNAA